MAENINEMKTISEKYDFSSENQSSEFILSEFSIKQEPELIIENEFETEKIQNYLQKSDITSEDRLGLVWYDCEICEERFLSQEDLSSHIKTHENPELYDTASANQDEQSHINNDNKFKCNVCDRTFDAKESLEIHYPIHLKEGSFQCEQCHESFQYLRYLIAHRESHNKKEMLVEYDGFKCYSCDLSFDTEDSLVLHYQTHTRFYKCESCGEWFETIDSLHIHRRRCLGIPYKCDRCDFSCFAKKFLDEHSLTHKKELPFKCEYCSESFQSLADLMTHSDSHRSPYKCDRCNRFYQSKLFLKRHYITHGKERPFKCEFCGFSSNHASNLSQHMVKHKKIRKKGIITSKY